MTLEVGIEIEASAGVTRSDHAEECLAAHPGEACPGYPHSVANVSTDGASKSVAD